MHNSVSAVEQAVNSGAPTARPSRGLVVIVAGYGDSLVGFRGDLIRELRARGYSVLALAPELSAESKKWLKDAGVEYVESPLSRTGMNPVEDLQYLTWLWKQLHERSPEILMAYTIKAVIYGLIASSLAGVPRRYALVTGLGYAFSGSGVARGLLSRVAKGLYALALRQAHGVFFQNPDDREMFLEAGLLPTRIPSHVVNGSGVDVARYAFTPQPEGRLAFLLIARLLGDKGVREYVSAARLLKQRGHDVTVRLVGWIDKGPDAIEQRELDSWIAEGIIEYLGKVADVRPAIAASSVYVLPSYREGTPRTVLEAMAMGRPIITTDAPGCRETVVHGDNGFLVPVRSVPELAQAMERFIEDPALTLRMGRRSREIAETKYDVRQVNAQMLRAMLISE
jgi:glycosyltransferase involved in cell wall biosynthesis